MSTLIKSLEIYDCFRKICHNSFYCMCIILMFMFTYCCFVQDMYCVAFNIDFVKRINFNNDFSERETGERVLYARNERKQKTAFCCF